MALRRWPFAFQLNLAGFLFVFREWDQTRRLHERVPCHLRAKVRFDKSTKDTNHYLNENIFDEVADCWASSCA